MSVKARQRLERMIARRLILDAIAAGYSLNVNNGGDRSELIRPSRNVREVLSVMFATDDEHLLFFKDGKRVGWAWLIYGNSGWDVISDYSTNLDPIMAGASALADKYS